MLGNLNMTPVTKTCYFSDGLLLQCASIIGSQNCRVWGFFLQQCFPNKLGHCFSFFSPLRVFQFCFFLFYSEFFLILYFPIPLLADSVPFLCSVCSEVEVCEGEGREQWLIHSVPLDTLAETAVVVWGGRLMRS